MKLRIANQTGSGSVVIPKHIISNLGWNRGDEVEVQKTKKGVFISNKTLEEESMENYKDTVAMVSLPRSCNYELRATELWCDITNALIAKYKNMAEDSPVLAIAELEVLRNLLLNTGLLNEADLSLVK